MPRPAWWRFEPTPANTKSPLSKPPTVTGPLRLLRPPRSRRPPSNQYTDEQVTPLCSTLTVVGAATGRPATPSPTGSRFRCHHPPRPSATAAAGHDGLVGRLTSNRIDSRFPLVSLDNDDAENRAVAVRNNSGHSCVSPVAATKQAVGRLPISPPTGPLCRCHPTPTPPASTAGDRDGLVGR
jgi:hypothetical protein